MSWRPRAWPSGGPRPPTGGARAGGVPRGGGAGGRPPPADRRARIVVVTEEGRRVAAAGAQIVDRVHDDVLQALPEAERDVLTSALARLAQGHLATPVECEQPVRRRREARK